MEVTLRGGRAPRSAEQNDIKKLWRFKGLDASETDSCRRAPTGVYLTVHDQGKRDAFFEAAFVECANLLEKYDGVLGKPELSLLYFDMSGKLGFRQLRSDRTGDYGRRILIADVVLYYKYGARAALLGSDNGA